MPYRWRFWVSFMRNGVAKRRGFDFWLGSGSRFAFEWDRYEITGILVKLPLRKNLISYSWHQRRLFLK